MSDSVLILKSGKCSWSKCFFCGYGKSIGYEPKTENIKKDFDRFFEKVNDCYIKVFGSGSFLDEKQVSKVMRKYFIGKCHEKNVKNVTIESRPEYITEEKLKEFKGIDLTVAIGLEVADDEILDKLNKGFHLRNYENAVEKIKKSGAKVRTYILVNLPFIEEIQKYVDKSVDYTLKFSDSIVLINLLPHQDSDLFGLWINGEWNFLDRKQFYKVTEKWRDNEKIELDVETFKFIPRFPRGFMKPLVGVGEGFLTHPYFEVWQDYINRWYIPPKDKDILLFLPCSYKKPYSESETHRKIIQRLKKLKNYDRIHQVMISNPGVIPREFENLYPFNSYDWNEKLETDEIKRRYIEVTTKRIKNYLTSHRDNYNGMYCFLKYDSESFLSLRNACHELDIKLTNLLKEETYKRIKDNGQILQTDNAIKDLDEIEHASC